VVAGVITPKAVAFPARLAERSMMQKQRKRSWTVWPARAEVSELGNRRAVQVGLQRVIRFWRRMMPARPFLDGVI
jgi:hypothetical protein